MTAKRSGEIFTQNELMKKDFQQPEYSLPKTEPAIAVSGGYAGFWRDAWKRTAGDFADRFIAEMDHEGWWHRKKPLLHISHDLEKLYDIEPSGQGVKFRPKS